MKYLIRTAATREQWVADTLSAKPGITATYEGYDGYVSVEFDGEPQFDAVKRQAFVGGFVLANGTYATQKPASRPQTPRKAFTKLVTGDEVLIQDGVMKGCTGVVSEITDKIRIEIQMLGTVSFLDLYDHQLKKIEKTP